MATFGPTEAAIARTPEGTVFVDVLSTKAKNHLSDKNIKDYDTLKWEEELRSQVAAKKGQQRKLTQAEQAKVNAQMAKEASIRRQVHRMVLRIERGAGIVRSLARGPPTDAAAWINEAVDALLLLAHTDAGLFVGDTVTLAYLACAARVTSRLGTLRPSIGVATLRALGKPYLPPEMQEETLTSKLPHFFYDGVCSHRIQQFWSQESFTGCDLPLSSGRSMSYH